ncbi:MAG TPA: universal stress protein [Polyangiaceae bacterium]|jgi:nucleotide-binding universal stress UspA family protein
MATSPQSSFAPRTNPAPTAVKNATRMCIVVALGFSDADGPAFDQAVRLARHAPGSELHLVHVFDRAPSEARRDDLVEHLRLYVSEKAEFMGGLAGMTVGIHLRAGKVVRELTQMATDVSADLVVVGAPRRSHLEHWIAGSTADRMVASAGFPVLVASRAARDREPVVPAIEPPCAECVKTRAGTNGARWWCERHAHAAASHGHTYSYQREIPLATHDSEVSPTGIDF